MLCEPIFDEGRGVRRRVDGDPNVFEKIGEGADMILVTVSDDDRPKVLALRSQPAEVWVHELGTILIGEADAAVDGDRGVAADHGGAVHADLVEPAQGDEA